MFRIMIFRRGHVMSSDALPQFRNRLHADGTRHGILSDPDAFLVYDAS